MAEIQGMSIGVKLDTVQVEQGLTGLKRELKTANAEFKNQLSAFDYGEKSMDKYEAKLKGMNRQLETQQRVTAESEEKYKNMVEQYGEGSRQAQNAEREYQNQSAALQNLNRNIENTTQEMEEFKKQQDIANSGWTKTGDKLQSTGQKMSDVGGKVQGFGKKWAKVTGVIAGAVTGAGAAIFGLTNKITENAFEIRNQAAQMGVSTDSYQEMDYWAQQNGLSQQGMEKIVGRLNQRIGEAKNGNEKYQGALEDVGVSMEDVKDGTLDTEDAFTESIQNLSEMEDKQEMVGKATELFGQRTARQLLPALEDGSLSMEDAREKAEELGIVMSEDEIEASADFQASMVDIKQSLASVGREIGISVMPYMQQFADYMMDHMPQIKETVSGAFDSVVSNVKGVVNWFQELNPTTQKAIGAFAGVAAAVGPVSIALGGLMKIFGPITTGIGKLFTVFGKLGGILPAIKVGITALTGQVGLTVAAIAGLTAGLVTAYKKSETFRDIVNGLKDAFLNAVSGIKEFFTTNETVLTVVDSIKSAFNSMKTMVNSAIRGIVSFFQSQITKMRQFWDENGQQIKQAFVNIFKGIKAVVQPVIQTIVDIVKKAMPAIKTTIKIAFTTIKDLTQNIWNGIKGVIDGVLKAVRGVIKTFSGLFTGDFSKMWDGIKDIFSGTLKAIKSIVKTAFNNIKTITSGIWEGIKSITKAAWNKVKAFVVNPVKGLVNTAKGSFNSFKSTVGSIFNGIKDSVSEKVTWMIDKVKAMPGKMKEGVKNGGKSIKDGFLFVAARMVDGIKSGVNGIIDAVNWAWSKLGGKENKFSYWKPSADWYTSHAEGTDGHPGGPALVNDGKGSNAGQELIQTPDGQTGAFKGKNVMANLPKGTHVTSAKETKQVVPRYAWGTDALKKAWDTTASGVKTGAKWTGEKAKQAGGKVKDGTLWLGKKAKDGAKAVLNQAMKVVGVKKPANKNNAMGLARQSFGSVKDAAVEKLKSFVSKKQDEEGGGDQGSPDGKGVKRWKPQVKKALKANDLSTSGKMVNKVLRQIATESGGDEKTVQSPDVKDINTEQGNPARGLMQTIPETFNANKFKGHGDIMNGYDNMLAALKYAKNKYGKDLSFLGKGHGYKQGTNFVPEDQPAFLHKGESVIPKEYNKKPSEAMKLLALAGKNVQKDRQEEPKTDFDDMMQLLKQLVDKDSGNIEQNITFTSTESKPSENAKKMKKSLQRMAQGL